MVYFGADVVIPHSFAHAPIFDAWAVRASGNVRVGTGIHEIIYTGAGEQFVGLGVCGNKEVEQSRGYTRALRDPCFDVS